MIWIVVIVGFVAALLIAYLAAERGMEARRESEYLEQARLRGER